MSDGKSEKQKEGECPNSRRREGSKQGIIKQEAAIFKILLTGEFDFVKTFRIRRYDGFFRSLISKCNILLM